MPPAKKRISEQARSALRAWIRAGAARHGLSPTALAAAIGVTTTTITKFLNNRDYTSTPGPQTIAALEEFFGEAAPSLTSRQLARAPRLHGLGEEEAEEYRLPEAGGKCGGRTTEQALVEHLCGPGCTPWRLTSAELAGAGYLPGDILIVDLAATPRDGDIVCARLYDAAAGTARTIFRLWQRPWLVTAPLGTPRQKPQLVEDEKRAIRGVVVRSLRGRRTAKSANHLTN